MWCCMSPKSMRCSSLLSSLLCGQALERQKEYFDCIRNERDELRDELADIKAKSKAGEVGPQLPPRPEPRRKMCVSLTTISLKSLWVQTAVMSKFKTRRVEFTLN